MSRGFTLVEVLIATAISALLAGAVATAVPPLQAFFEQAPAAIDVQQRARTAIDAIAQAVRAADNVLLLDEDAVDSHFRQLMTIAPRPYAAQGVVADQSDPGGDVWLGAEQCPGVPDVCGFSRGSIARITDSDGRFELFVVGSVDAAARRLSPRRRFADAYAATATVVEVDAFTFRLDPAPDGSSTLVRETAAGAVQPIADGVTALKFARALDDRGIDVTLTLHSHGTRAGETTRRMAIVTRNLP